MPVPTVRHTLILLSLPAPEILSASRRSSHHSPPHKESQTPLPSPLSAKSRHNPVQHPTRTQLYPTLDPPYLSWKYRFRPVTFFHGTPPQSLSPARAQPPRPARHGRHFPLHQKSPAGRQDSIFQVGSSNIKADILFHHLFLLFITANSLFNHLRCLFYNLIIRFLPSSPVVFARCQGSVPRESLRPP